MSVRGSVIDPMTGTPKQEGMEFNPELDEVESPTSRAVSKPSI